MEPRVNDQPLLNVSEALAKLLEGFAPLEAELVPTAQGLDRVMAEDVVSDIDLPPFANSSMDGYAVRASDLASASRETPVSLPVSGDIPAGAGLPAPLRLHSAARIMTGAPLPDGADTIVPVEDTDDLSGDRGGRPPESIRLFRQYRPGAFVRLAGQDLRAGELVLKRGSRLRPQELGVLAALGRDKVRVVRRPRVAVLVSGDELLGIDEPLSPGKIRDVNGYTVPGLITRYGGIPLSLGIARDRVTEIKEKLDAALDRSADLVVSSAGVSVGAFDFIKDVVEHEGSLSFWRVNMRPGKPVAFGRYRGIPFLGLPGNPVSAMVSFEVFARPAILKMGGRARLDKPSVSARLAEPLTSDGRESYLRATVERRGDGYVARTTGDQGSGILSSLVKANALIIVPAGVKQVAAGERLTAWMMDWPEEFF